MVSGHLCFVLSWRIWVLDALGVLAFNLVARDSDKRAEVQSTVDRHFPQVLRQTVEGELNEVLLCFCEKRSESWMKEYEKRMQSMCKRLGNSCSGFSDLKGSSSVSIDGLLEKLANL